MPFDGIDPFRDEPPRRAAAAPRVRAWHADVADIVTGFLVMVFLMVVVGLWADWAGWLP